MKILSLSIPDLVLIEPAVFGDARGYFLESWRDERYAEAGILADFVQDNVSLSGRGILRGLHAQFPNPQGKLVQVLQGSVYDVAVDLRRGSPTFGQHIGVELSDRNHRQLWIPPGFAHGFVALSETALFQYKCTAYYSPKDELTVHWDDPELGIEWPVKYPLVSPKDSRGFWLRDVPENRLMAYKEEECLIYA